MSEHPANPSGTASEIANPFETPDIAQQLDHLADALHLQMTGILKRGPSFIIELPLLGYLRHFVRFRLDLEWYYNPHLSRRIRLARAFPRARIREHRFACSSCFDARPLPGLPRRNVHFRAMRARA